MFYTNYIYINKKIGIIVLHNFSNMKKQKIKFTLKIFRIFFTCYFVFLVGINTTYAQIVKKGIIDLQNINILNENVVDLSGEWQFEYGKHLSANEMNSIPSSKKTYLKIPSSWTSITKNGKSLPAHGVGTYYLRVILDKKQKNHGTDYGFSIGNIVTAYKLWVNDNLITQAGTASTNNEIFRPVYLPQSCFCKVDKDTLNIVIQVSNFYDPVYAGLWQKIYIGKRDKIISFDWRSTTFTLFILSAFVLLFFYQFSLTFVQKKEKSHFIIALLSLISMIKMLLDGPVSIYNFLPNLDFTIYYRFWLFSFFVIYLILRLTKLTYPLEINKAIVKFFDWFYLISSIAFIFVDIQLVLSNIILIVYANLICLGYLFWVLTRAVIRGRAYSFITLISFTVMVMFVLNDLIYVVTQSSYGYLSHVGVIIYIVIQSITISLKFALSHDMVLQLSNELIDANRNLEEQVEVRTKELHQVNIELGIINKQKDLLISTISHDLMGTFNVMINFSKALYRDNSLTEKQHKTTTQLYQTSNKGYFMLDNILAWAKMHITYKQEIKRITNLSIIIEENIYLLADQINNKSLETTIIINDDLHFNSSIENLNTIIRNLLSNSIKFSHAGGKIIISNQKKEGYMQIIIGDNGIGMSSELCETVFDPEIEKRREGTSGERGSGLGLFIVKELVESNKGRITCKSNVNIGSEFIIKFPLHSIN